MGIESRYIWMDSKLVDFADATVHFLNVGLHYGMAVFEGIRCYNTAQGPAVFRLKEHVERLIDSAHVLGMRDLPWTAEDMAEAIKQTVAANDFDECYIRPLIWLADGGWNIKRRWREAAPGHCHVGVGRLFRRGRDREWHPRQYFIVHAPP